MATSPVESSRPHTELAQNESTPFRYRDLLAGGLRERSVVIYEGRLYVVRNGGIVHCRDPRDGSQFFRGRLGSIGGYYASPVAGDGKIYFASDRGIITVIASGDTLEVLARNDLEERIMATPALVAGSIYVRTAAHLYAFGSKTEADEHP